MRQFSALLAVLLLVTACAKPVTRAPKLDPNEVAAERAAEQQMLQEASVNPSISQITSAEVSDRINRTAPAIQKAGRQICRELRGLRQNCTFNFAVKNDKAVNAYADGETVYVTPAIVALTQTQEELAMVLAHEYAHNILEHPQGAGMNAAAGSIVGTVIDQVAGSQGVPTGGLFSNVGGNLGAYHYSVPFEKEADYVGLYILARADFDLERGTNIWRRLSMVDAKGLYTSTTHPGNPERVVAMRRTITEIRAKQTERQPLLPEMRKE